MKCIEHPDKEAITQCSQCKKHFCKECVGLENRGESYICIKCTALKATNDIRTELEQRLEEKNVEEDRKKKKAKIRKILPWGILVICILIIIIQVPKIISAFKAEQPFRRGTYSTDSMTDKCISNLWRISKMLQEGKVFSDDIVCPASKMPYVITSTEEDILVQCSNPELHGFRKVFVSKKSAVPEIIK